MPSRGVDPFVEAPASLLLHNGRLDRVAANRSARQPAIECAGRNTRDCSIATGAVPRGGREQWTSARRLIRGAVAWVYLRRFLWLACVLPTSFSGVLNAAPLTKPGCLSNGHVYRRLCVLLECGGSKARPQRVYRIYSEEYLAVRR